MKRILIVEDDGAIAAIERDYLMLSDFQVDIAATGPEGLEIRCENDWFNHNGRIKLTIANVDGGTPIVRYYHPDTLNRDYVAEDAEKEDEAKQARKEWVQALGPELAHKLIDQYWEG